LYVHLLLSFLSFLASAHEEKEQFDGTYSSGLSTF